MDTSHDFGNNWIYERSLYSTSSIVLFGLTGTVSVGDNDGRRLWGTVIYPFFRSFFLASSYTAAISHCI